LARLGHRDEKRKAFTGLLRRVEKIRLRDGFTQKTRRRERDHTAWWAAIRVTS
jgi:hypothetical protein